MPIFHGLWGTKISLHNTIDKKELGSFLGPSRAIDGVEPWPNLPHMDYFRNCIESSSILFLLSTAFLTDMLHLTPVSSGPSYE